MRVLVTGASGFVGSALLPALTAAGHEVRTVVRPSEKWTPPDGIDGAPMENIGPDSDWSAALDGIEGIVHLAARTHVMRETAVDPLVAYRHLNVEGTRRLAEAAAEAGVRRLVYLSSIKVNGERTLGCAYTEAFEPMPEDAYGITKWEAERALAQTASTSQLETVVIRPPLVYGPGVKANFLSLLNICARSVPLPLANVRNRRSLISVANLADGIRTGLENPRAAGQTFVIADGEDLSTPDLIRHVAEAMGRPARLFPVPQGLLLGTARLLGRSATAERLLGSLRVDDRKIRKILAWQPPQSMVEGLRETVAWYLHRSDR
jgi:UDP-N-acetyl-alpha-D-quinovosamine dehydrogenase